MSTNEIQIDTKSTRKSQRLIDQLNVQQQQPAASTNASTVVQSPALADVNYENTGKMSNIFWHKMYSADVANFRDTITMLTENLGKGARPFAWCTLIVVQDISSDQLIWHFLGHQDDKEPPRIANMLWFP